MSRLAIRLSAVSSSSAAVAASAMAIPVVTVAHRTMAHNPKYMRDAKKQADKYAALRVRLLSGETLIPKPDGGERRRRDRFYDFDLAPAISGKQIIPAPAQAESWIYNLEKQRVGIAPLARTVFNADTSRVDLVQRVVEWQRASARQGTHKSLGRSEVAGTGKKLAPQKGGGTSSIHNDSLSFFLRYLRLPFISTKSETIVLCDNGIFLLLCNLTFASHTPLLLLPTLPLQKQL